MSQSKTTEARPIALIIHALAENATTQGLSPVVRINVRWLHARFRSIARSAEGANPLLRKAGFGIVMVDALVERQLRGSIKQEWPEEGLAVVIRLP